jgi:hypothetical protein
MNYYLNGTYTVQASDGFQVLPVGSSYIASAADVDVQVTIVPPGDEFAAPIYVAGGVNQVPGITNGLPTHTGAASGSAAATTITGDGSGAEFGYVFAADGSLFSIAATVAGTGYKEGDLLTITTAEAHVINFRLVKGSNRAEVTVEFDATQPCQFLPFPVREVKVLGTTDRTILYAREHS